MQSLDDYFLSGSNNFKLTTTATKTSAAVAPAAAPAAAPAGTTAFEDDYPDEAILEAIEMKVEDEDDDNNEILRNHRSVLRDRPFCNEQSFSFSLLDNDNGDDESSSSTSHTRRRSSSLVTYNSNTNAGGTASTLNGGGMKSARSDVDLPWLDVGAKIGMQLLNSAHVHRAVVASAETKERFMESSRELLLLEGSAESHQHGGGTSTPHTYYDSNHHYNSHLSSFPTITPAQESTNAARKPMLQSRAQFPHNVLPSLQVAGAGSQQPQPSTKLSKPIHAFWTSATAVATKYEQEDEDNNDDDESEEFDGQDIAVPRLDMDTSDDEAQKVPHHLTIITTKISEGGGSKSQFSAVSMETVNNNVTAVSRSDKGAGLLLDKQSSDDGSLHDCNNNDNDDQGLLSAKHALQGERRIGPVHGTTELSRTKDPCEVQSTLTQNKDAIRSDHTISPETNRACPTITDQDVGNPKKKSLPHSKGPESRKRRSPLAPGVKVAVPLFPYQPHTKLQHRGVGGTTCLGRQRKSATVPYQMGSVVSSHRIFVKEDGDIDDNATNCLSVTVQLDKSFLRNGEFAELTFRVMDSWIDDRYMPAHSKVPVGSCVATTFGLGVLVGWRVEDDCHVVRSLWQRRGPGASCAYLNRSAIHCVMEAAVGFHVQTKFGSGVVLAYVDGGGKRFDRGRFLVNIQEEGRQHQGQVVELYRPDILGCPGAQFIPVIEHIREAAHFQIQVDNYKAALRAQQLGGLDPDSGEEDNDGEDEMKRSTSQSFWQTASAWAEIMWNSFLKAVEDDEGDAVDSWLNDLIQSIVVFLERLDEHPQSGDGSARGFRESNLTNEEKKEPDQTFLEEEKEREKWPSRKLSFDTNTVVSGDFEIELVASHDNDKTPTNDEQMKNETQAWEPGLWVMNDIFGGVFSSKSSTTSKTTTSPGTEDDDDPQEKPSKKVTPSDRDTYYNRVFAVLRTLMKTVSIARVASVEHPHLRLALAIIHDVFMFCRTFLKVQRRNVSVHSIEIWNRAIDEASSTFGPIHERLEKIGQGMAQRMEKQGRRAKARLLMFADTLLGDERLLFALEQGDWDKCAIRLEMALVKSKIVEKENLLYYRKAASFVHRHWKLIISGDALAGEANSKLGGAAARNNEKLALLAQFVQWIAAPRRSLLKLFERNDVLEVFERILVRVFHKKEEMASSRMLVIHASNFHSLRHLRLLKDFSTSGRRLWMPILEAADEEFSWLVSQLPFGETWNDFMVPLSNLFSLCVAHFHKIDRDLTTDWMDFLLEDEAVQIIHEIDTKLILALESFARDVKDMMLVLPYYSSIDDDLLGLMDEVDLDEFLREASEAMEDEVKLNEFIREKATIAIERFLNYLPRMSIPVEKRELMEGWVLTCRGEDGGDLTLSDVKVKRENLICQILGGDALFFPMFGGGDSAESNSGGGETMSQHSPLSSAAHFPNIGRSVGVVEESSVLDHIRDLLLQAQSHGCWRQGVGGIVQPPSDRYVASVLDNLPVSTVLNCGIELWRNLEIDDDELLEIAVHDVAYQIQLQNEREENENQEQAERIGVTKARSEDSPDIRSAKSASFSRTSGFGSSSSGSMHRKVHDFPIKPNPALITSFDSKRNRFNPRVDPTVFFLEMRNLTLNLDKFWFRIEKSEHARTLLDPVFDGKGSLLIQNVSIRVRIECAKERMRRTTTLLGETFTPILALRELTISLEKVDLKVKDTGFGSDWLVNKAVEAFADDITKVVAENLREQIIQQVNSAIENLNAYFLMNPNMLLNLLGISIEDLDDQIAWV